MSVAGLSGRDIGIGEDVTTSNLQQRRDIEDATRGNGINDSSCG